MPQVINNTVLANFCMVDRLDILRTLFGKVYITHEVREEVCGTLGILKLAIELELLSAEEGNELLREMTAAGYHSPYDDLRDMDEA